MIRIESPREFRVSDLWLNKFPERTTRNINPALNIEGENPANAVKIRITIMPIILRIFRLMRKNDNITIMNPAKTERLKPDAAKRWASPVLFI